MTIVKQLLRVPQWMQHQKHVVDQVGGLSGMFWRIIRENDIRTGTLVGSDKYGNKYYENNKYMMGRNRFVVYPYEGREKYDGSQIPPEWHRWMQHMTDDSPVAVPPTPRKFIIDHQVNHSGSKNRYVPYSTTQPKIESWT